MIGDGTLFDKVGIDTDETDGVTARNIGNSLDLTSHHEDGTLDVLDVKIVLGAGFVVGSHDSDLLSSGDGTSEDTTESVEATTITGGYHLGDEDHKRTILIAIGDGLTAGIINGTFVKVSSSVLLGLDGGGELHDDHLKESLSSVNPLLADDLHKILKTSFLLFGVKDNLELIKHLEDNVEVTVHNVTDEGNDGLHDELDEAAGELAGVTIVSVLCEFLFLRVEVVVTPELFHELEEGDLELVGVDTGKTGKGESPSEKSGTESDGTVGGVNLLGLTHIVALVGGDDDVCVLNDTEEVLIHSLTVDLEFEDTTIDLVNEEDGLDLLTESLTEHGFGLDTDTFDVIDDDEGTIGDTESSGDLGGEVDVPGRVDKVDKIWDGVNLVDNVGLEVKGDTGGFDGDTTLLLVGTSVGGADIASLVAGNNTSFGNEGVSEGGLAVIDVSDDRHVTDLVRLTHDFSNLVNSEVWHIVWSVLVKLLIVINPCSRALLNLDDAQIK